MTESTIIPRVGVGVILETPEGFVLLQRQGSHGANTWCWPGGHLEANETVLACAAREVLEETGVTLQQMQVLPWFTEDFFPESHKHYITLYVYGKTSACATIQEPEKASSMVHVQDTYNVDLSGITQGKQFSGVDESWRRFIIWRKGC